MNANEIVHKWFSGKTLVNALNAVEILEKSTKAQYWVDRSTKMAAFGKSRAIAKMAKGLSKKYEYATPEHHVAFALEYGLIERLVGKDLSSMDLPANVKEAATDMQVIATAIAKVNETHEAAKKMAAAGNDKNPMGICACCFAAHKIKPSGTMFKHGYERPGFGYVVGGCPGENFPPYEV